MLAHDSIDNKTMKIMIVACDNDDENALENKKGVEQLIAMR
jgi:hypothetical protein